MKYKYNDGGRSEHFKGHVGDCVTRAIVIASGLPYKKVYDDLFKLSKDFNKVKTKRYKSESHPRHGVHRKVYDDYILSLGFTWVPTMLFGKGCQVHLKSEELPKGRLIVAVSKHMTCVIDGVIYDTYDPSREGTRCVYGYYIKN